MRKQARARSETTGPPGLGKEMGTQLTAPTDNLLENIDGFVKSPSAALRFTFVVVAYLVSTPHSSGFARLASGAFYFAIVLRPFDEIINIGFSILSLPIRPSAPHFIRQWML